MDPLSRARLLLEEAERLLYRRVQGNRRATRELVLVREALALLPPVDDRLAGASRPE